MLHVPLIMHIPGGEHVGRVDELVSIVDIAPTILAAAGVKDNLGGIGQDLSPLIVGKTGRLPREYVVAEDPSGHVSFRSREMKYIVDSDGRERLFDLKRDPGELENLIEEEPDLARSWLAIRESHQSQIGSPRGVQVRYTREEARYLKSLGYVN
jgi:arylsulfatase A-like enzyme